MINDLSDGVIQANDVYVCDGRCRNDFNVNVLKAFVNLHEFSDTILVQALRYHLCWFILLYMFML